MAEPSEGVPRNVIVALTRSRIRTLQQLRTASDEDLLDIRGIGEGTLRVIREALDGTDIEDDAPITVLNPFSRRDEEIVRLADQGQQYTDIAARYSLSPARVAQLVARARRERPDRNDDEQAAG